MCIRGCSIVMPCRPRFASTDRTMRAPDERPDMNQEQTPIVSLLERIANRSAVVGVIGLGYVGLPLAAATARAGFVTNGFDIDAAKVAWLTSGRSYIDAVPDAEL